MCTGLFSDSNCASEIMAKHAYSALAVTLTM
jgi:hypothetical protein